MIELIINNTTKFPYAQFRDAIRMRLVGCKAYADHEIVVSDSRQGDNAVTLVLGSADCAIKSDMKISLTVRDLDLGLPTIEEFLGTTVKRRDTAGSAETPDADEYKKIVDDTVWYLSEMATLRRLEKAGTTSTVSGEPTFSFSKKKGK